MSEHEFPTRFSTPVSDLDDHRGQSEALPRADPARESRRPTLASIGDDRPSLLSPQPVLIEEAHPVARDFEHAIVDDNASVRSSQRGQDDLHTPIVARRAVFRRPLNDPRSPDGARRPSHASTGSRSSSPPNSVDAFAAPRRPRAGTMDSQAVSMTNKSLSRAGSNASRSRRRPTFEDMRRPELRDDEPRSARNSVEADVCFPPPEEKSKTYTIDFEELEEFVTELHNKTPVAHPFTAPNGAQGQGVPSEKLFNDLRLKRTDSQAACAECLKANLGIELDEKDSLEKECSHKDDLTTSEPSPIMNRWTMFSSEMDETIHAPELSGLLMQGETFRDLFELGPEGGMWWLDMLNPSEEEVIAICKAFGVHPLTREDITTQETREKVELFHSYYFVCFRSFYQETQSKSDPMEPINIYAVVFREGLLSFSFCPNPHAANVRKRIGRLRDYVNLSADWVCYAMMYVYRYAFAHECTDDI